MTPEDKTALAARLRVYAAEYAKISKRAAGIQQMVNDLLAAAAELEGTQ